MNKNDQDHPHCTCKEALRAWRHRPCRGEDLVHVGDGRGATADMHHCAFLTKQLSNQLHSRSCVHV